MTDPSLSTAGTVVALASAPGRAGVSVLRASGPAAGSIIEKLCSPGKIPEPRRATLRDLIDFRTGELTDHALVLWFPAPHSFTGEDVLELHVHGGRSIILTVLELCCQVPGVRPAEPGAFSRRAFENGKMDLTEAEGIADLVEAETAAQRRQALRQMDGALGKLYQEWGERLKKSLAYIEAEIDFSDEELPPDLVAGRLADVRQLIQDISAHLDDRHRGERLREGFTVALLGAPNAGKSSLLNALAQREAAIVSPIPGTTRDIIEVQLDLGGYPVALADTAGLRESVDTIEGEGVRRALRRAEQADFKLLVFDGAQWPSLDSATLALQDEQSFVVVNKTDIFAGSREALPVLKGAQPLFVSAQTGEGLSELTQRLAQEIDIRFMASSQPALTRVRHRAALEEALGHLQRGVAASAVELCAEDLRLALRAIGRITGRVDVEDLLDVIFSSFCIGK